MCKLHTETCTIKISAAYQYFIGVQLFGCKIGRNVVYNVLTYYQI
ncbi:Uncharacterised protein [Prevotella nigrescens]|nr:hypothetical protein HMPREF9419_0946 [Prevotella nigrescens ATCC 33563]SUB92723.1 Uncharacterised protein [Prevotella nigrescens]